MTVAFKYVEMFPDLTAIDARSLRIMRSFAIEALTKDARLRQSIVDGIENGETDEYALRRWDELLGGDKIKNETAEQKLTAELNRRGVDLY